MKHWVIDEIHPHGHRAAASRCYDTRAEARFRLAELAEESVGLPADMAAQYAVTRRSADMVAFDHAPCGCDSRYGEPTKHTGIVYRVVSF